MHTRSKTNISGPFLVSARTQQTFASHSLAGGAVRGELVLVKLAEGVEHDHWPPL